VWGIIAPLLLDDAIGFVKGFYDRPLEIGGVLQPSGGGRVTELMARPLLNLFWPALAGMVQPLSGEYAGRRDLLERVPFFSGYGVEIGLLIDILVDSGADAIAQVDVGKRIHRNQDLVTLSRMSFAIAHVALQRLSESGRAQFGDVLETRYVQFGRDDRGRMVLRPGQVADTERPPIQSFADPGSAKHVADRLRRTGNLHGGQRRGRRPRVGRHRASSRCQSARIQATPYGSTGTDSRPC
jgi:glucosyl-3-phosphoglycerate synthase